MGYLIFRGMVLQILLYTFPMRRGLFSTRRRLPRHWAGNQGTRKRGAADGLWGGDDGCDVDPCADAYRQRQRNQC